MKSTILGLGMFLCLLPTLTGQEPYAFGMEQAPYEPLENPVSLSLGQVWFGDEEWLIPIGFTFHFFGEPYTETALWEGSLLFEDVDVMLDAFGAALIDRGEWYGDGSESLSPVGYQLAGIPGERILKVEYHETGFMFGDLEDFLSLQIWLYEAYPLVEIRFGPGMVDPEVYTPLGWEGPYIGLANYLENIFFYIQGDPEDPEVYTADDLTDGLVGTPAEGTVYRFFPESLNLNVEAARREVPVEWIVEPGRLLLKGMVDARLESICLTDLSGKQVALISVKGRNTVDIRTGHIPEGIYVLSGTGPGTWFSEKVWISER